MSAALGQGSLLACELVSTDTARTEVAVAWAVERLAVAASTDGV
jgi:hypothetical protein